MSVSLINFESLSIEALSDEDRSTIMEMAGDYMAAGKLKHFVVMLHKAATDRELLRTGFVGPVREGAR